MTERVAVFLDYQNVHLAAHTLFAAYGARPETSLVHPVRVAECIVEKRRIDSELVSVRIFRGRPNPEHHPVPTAANDAQTAVWERDPRTTVVRRDLNYRGWPDHPPREKGIDVALAINLVESAMLGEYDAAVVFTGDTDLLPAIDMAFRRTQPRIEIAAWAGSKPSGSPRRSRKIRGATSPTVTSSTKPTSSTSATTPTTSLGTRGGERSDPLLHPRRAGDS